jgi:dTDP-4-dehydrorhamnose 3,5-epimerase
VGEREALRGETSGSCGSPKGFGHGYVLITESAEVLYKTTDYRYPQHQRSLLWNDPTIGIDWPLTSSPQPAPKDAAATTRPGGVLLG